MVENDTSISRNPAVNALPEFGSPSERIVRAILLHGVFAIASIKPCDDIWISIPDDTCILHRMWLKLSAVSMKPPLVRDFERFTAEEASQFFQNFQALGVPR